MTKRQIKRNLKLADALESEKYKQTNGQLRKDDCFCCLGVACDLVKRTLRMNWYKNYFTNRGNLPSRAVAKLYGWEVDMDGDSDPEIKVKGIFRKASSHNDTGATFKQIAKGFRKLAKEAEKKATIGK